MNANQLNILARELDKQGHEILRAAHGTGTSNQIIAQTVALTLRALSLAYVEVAKKSY